MSSIDEKEHVFKYISKSTRQKADVFEFNKNFYFTKFSGIEPERFNQVLRKTIREIRKNGVIQVPDNLYKFFNAQQRRKRFNLAPDVMFKIDIYDSVSLKLIECFDITNMRKYNTKDLGNYINPHFIVHIYDPKPMPKDLVHKNGKIQDFFNIENISMSSNISRYQGYQILNKIKNEEIKLYNSKSKTKNVNVLNWKQTIPQMKNEQIGMRGTTLHLAIGLYQIKIGNQKEREGHLISFNDKGPMVIFDGKRVESSNSSYQLVLGGKLIQSTNEKIVPELSSISFERDSKPFFKPSTVLHPKDAKFKYNKNNSFHSEFKILNNFVNQLELFKVNDKTEISGELFILSEKNPCYGCLDLLWNQFNEHFPNITLKYTFVYGIRASEKGFKKINLERGYSPIVVPNIQEERVKGFSTHSEFLLTNIKSDNEIFSYLSSFKRFNDMIKSIESYSNVAETFKRFNFPIDELYKVMPFNLTNIVN